MGNRTGVPFVFAYIKGGKMKSIILIIFVLISLLFNNNVFGQPKDVEGWSKSRWGMTEDEILKVFEGEAKKLEKKKLTAMYMLQLE